MKKGGRNQGIQKIAIVVLVGLLCLGLLLPSFGGLSGMFF